MKTQGRVKGQRGFTLIELAIVLVIIGLIIGMAMKGKALIDGAKVKNLAAQYNKIVAAINTFYERYGFYPGDGCTSGSPTSVSDCTGTKNGVLDNDNERAAFWTLLIDRTHILTRADRRSVFGQDWNIWYGAPHGGNNVDWLDLPGGAQADSRLVCALDKLIDDGEYNTGVVQAYDNYDDTTDCWNLSGQTDMWIKVLP
ncbi:MAG: prepilin-type N-terminal cleavage/methylation domain-containing protein [Desulfonauticus sp.]|nr:prepilin-type N-terminal cleavage/methylation domain-containing protein [Desulfonauticus sp.]